MHRNQVLAMAAACFDSGKFRQTLAQRVAVRTESQEAASGPLLHAYLSEHLIPDLERMGFFCRVVGNPVPGQGPFLIAERIETDAAFTVLTYGHGDVVRGHDKQWREGLTPWNMVVEGDCWYGRGTADNKGQHSINFAALAQVIDARGGRLGYNVKLVFEMGEETGSPGLAQVCETYRDQLKADVFIASDGPRVSASRPTVFLGSRGGVNFDLRVRLRDGGYHSGNWGGLLRNPGIRLANAIASMVDERGRIKIPSLLPKELPDNVRNALRSIEVAGGPDDPEIDADWGEPGLSPAERVIGWNALEVLAFKTGNPDSPVNAIPGHAYAHCQIRYVVGSDSDHFLEHIRAHLDAHGYTDVELTQNGPRMEATRLDPDHPWVSWTLSSLRESTGKAPALLPNLGGTLPNDIFACQLQLPTLWIPHSYPACAQHSANEHMLGSVAREALRIMAGVFWDLGESAARTIASGGR